MDVNSQAGERLALTVKGILQSSIGWFACVVLLLFSLLGEVGAQLRFDRHVVFDNSFADSSLYQSHGMVIAPSELELRDGKVPVDGQRFLSPPNALRLRWKSASGGDWRVKIRAMPRHGHNLEYDGDTLSLWCYSERPLLPEESPRINLQDQTGVGSGTIELLSRHGALPAGKWVRLLLPLDGFKNLYPPTEDYRFNARKLQNVWLVQGLDDGKEHTLYLDDIQVCRSDAVDTQAPAPPSGLVAKGYDRHVDLTWKPSPDADVLSYRIHRSLDGTNFVTVNTVRNDPTRAVDFIGESGRKAHYRISAVDISGNESSLSSPVSVTTKSLSDDELLDMVQEACFRYYREAAHPTAGMAVEIQPGDKNLVAVGATGFGIMALIAGVERQFMSRDECAAQLLKMVRFLEKAERFHGAWPHFLDGSTGRITPYFGKYDNGGDLVETAFLIQGLLAARQYFDRDTADEKQIRDGVTRLWQEVEWDWYRKSPSSDFLYWHWSPDHDWYISHPLVGWNETMIVYLLAIASPTHAVPADLYHSGWAGQSEQAIRYRRNWSRTTQGDHYTNGNSYYDIKLDVGEGTGGDLFFTQFSFMGFDPRGKKDRYTNYYLNNRNIALINRAYCMENPRKFAGYSGDCWGLSAGINSGGGRPLPREDNGTICISAAIGSFPYTPEESMAALKHFYRNFGAKTWGVYGFHDGFNQTENWFEPVWLGLNQAVNVVMIENHRSGLLWKYFMAHPEIQPALEAIGFTEDRQASSR